MLFLQRNKEKAPLLTKLLYHMNKRILSVFVLSAAFLSVYAQQDKGGISPEMLNRIKQNYQGTTTDKAIRNAIGNNDIRKLALNQDNLKGMDTHFSIKVDSKGITDQKSSGRCWLFTGLNVMRAKPSPGTDSDRLSFLRITTSSGINWRKRIFSCKVSSTPVRSRWTTKWWSGCSVIR